MSMEDFKPEFYQIPHIVAEKSDPHESFVYAIIYWFVKMKEGHCWASNERISKCLPYKSSPQSVANAISKLSEHGFIQCIYLDEGKRNRKEIIPLVVYSINPQVKPYNPQVNRDTPTGEQIDISKQDKNYFSAKNDLSSDDDVTTVALDDWGEEYIKPQKKNPKTDEVINYFKKECVKHVGKNPAVALSVARKMVVAAREYLTDDQIKRMFDDWFRIGLPDNETMQITRALSTARINTFKADNGIK